MKRDTLGRTAELDKPDQYFVDGGNAYWHVKDGWWRYLHSAPIKADGTIAWEDEVEVDFDRIDPYLHEYSKQVWNNLYALEKAHAAMSKDPQSERR